MEGHNGSTRLPGADMPLVVKCVSYPPLYMTPHFPALIHALIPSSPSAMNAYI